MMMVRLLLLTLGLGVSTAWADPTLNYACGDLGLQGTWRRRHMTDPARPVRYRITQNACNLVVTEITGEAAGARWVINLNGQQDINVPEQVLRVNEGNTFNVGASGRTVLQTVRTRLNLERTSSSETLAVRARVSARAHFSVPLLDSIALRLQGSGYVTAHRDRTGGPVEHIQVSTREIHLEDFTIPGKNLNKSDGIYLLNLVARGITPLVAYFWDDQMALVREARP